MANDDGWRRMGSAPRDGTRILVTVRPSEQGPAAVDTAYWEAGSRGLEGGWRAADSHPDCIIGYQQSELMGWMPLPLPGSPATRRPMTEELAPESDGSGI